MLSNPKGNERKKCYLYRADYLIQETMFTNMKLLNDDKSKYNNKK